MLSVPVNIRTLLSGQTVEWARLEFKKTWDLKASLKTICAFANDIENWGGGYIVIGVDEKVVPFDRSWAFRRRKSTAGRRRFAKPAV